MNNLTDSQVKIYLILVQKDLVFNILKDCYNYQGLTPLRQTCPYEAERMSRSTEALMHQNPCVSETLCIKTVVVRQNRCASEPLCIGTFVYVSCVLKLMRFFCVSLQEDVPLPKLQPQRAGPLSPLQRLRGRGSGRPAPLEVPGRQMGPVRKS